ncbi:hypothetical protein EJ04DRAFT_76783 [Polyplosphaeria fusca]|uniref:Uncharacterized protein n=1 Tax=Polyplosphaeria fusca TaxID=682080 RepID=A0A9P4QPL9_9PLEO|nr:hypothetical protein EJ04DRAFT_76783 [Polyplosphaeria fusca]
MESAPIPRKISRIESRYRHLAQDLSRRDASAEPHEEGATQKEEDLDEPLLIREKKGRVVMGRGHRMFHRRQAEPSNVLTMVVEVVATIDTNGNIITQETNTPGVPLVPAVPTAPLPSVPAVPPFPTELTVPAYPWPSGIPSAPLAALPSSQLIISSSVSSVDQASTAAPSASSIGFNSTVSSTLPSSSLFSVTFNTTSSTSSSRTSTKAHSSSSRSSARSSTTSTSTASSSVSTSSLIPSSTTANFGGGGESPQSTALPPVSTSAAASGSDSDSNNALGTPQTVGAVIGSLAGAALILAVLLFLLKRHKQNQRRGALQLPADNDGDSQPLPAAGQQMATRSSFTPAGAAAFFSRFSGASRSTAETSTTTERGFQRISGRKLPSAFSEGMTSEQFARGEGTLSGSSFYRDDTGFYGGIGTKELGKETGEPSHSGAMVTKERIMPSPARTPVIHHPEGDLSPPHTPNPAVPRGTLGRSHPSHDGSRGSKFTEDV